MKATALYNWLVEGCPGGRTPVDVTDHMCTALRELGVPIDRTEAIVRTLHPHIAGRSFIWQFGSGVQVKERSFDYFASMELAESPAGEVIRTGEVVRRRGSNEVGSTDLVAAPLLFVSGQIHAIVFETTRAGGFSDDDVETLLSIIPPLSRMSEILALSRTAVNLLNTYVGHNAGERILSGKIKRGDVDSIRAVIWLSDLRGFTRLAATHAPVDVIGSLNDLFESQVAAIERHGGEVLKFIGDGLLAIFPIVDGGPPLSALCESTLAAAKEAAATLVARGQAWVAKGETALRFGLALHLGEITYGNIGGSGRLDFTCIGTAVNLAARLESLSGSLGHDIVLSDEFRQHLVSAVEPLGQFELKGFAAPQAVWAPRRQ